MRTSILLSFLFLSAISHAQLRIALIGGGHVASVNETNNLPNWNEQAYSGRTGIHAGFLADLQLGLGSRFYMQPSVQFTMKGRKFSQEYDTSVFNYSRIDGQQYVNYIEIPLHLVYKIPVGKQSKFLVGAGPYASFFYSGRERTDTWLKSGSVTTDEVTDLPVGDAPGKYQTMEAGVSAVAGIEFNRVFLTANFSRGLTDFYTPANYEGKLKHQVFGGTIGIFIGKPVKISERIYDRDEDGIVDNADSCIDEAGPLLTNGCPDTDSDGLADRLDKCPEVPGLVKYDGCPVKDTDGDGVVDPEDKCIEVPGMAKYAGCPIPDTDADGINDEQDSCITVPGLVRYNGCPIPDRDKDNINDEEDRCPDQPGIAANNGCPEIKKETIEKVQYAAGRIQFRVNSAVLLSSSYKELDELVKLLNEDSTLLLDIEGHTSSEGSYEVNMKLSQERANTVKNYLASKGIAESRLNAQGFGPDQPLNENRTEAERAANRRVELKVRNN